MTTSPALRLARLGLPLLTVAALTAACGTSNSYGTSQPTTAAVSPAASGGKSLQLSDGHLTDGTGRTVYLWVADTSTTSHCAGACARVWPPVTVTGQGTTGSGLSASLLTTIKRSGGTAQLTYAGHPLYYYAADSTPGDAKGQGSDSFGSKWWELNNTGQAITTTAPAPTAPSTASTGGGAYGY